MLRQLLRIMSTNSLVEILASSPVGHEATIATLPCYTTGTSSTIAILYIHDLLGFRNHNARILSDYYAQSIGATVYLPDFFSGRAPKPADVPTLDFLEFKANFDKPITFPLILGAAKQLRQKYSKVGVIGFCFGGWSGFALGSSTLRQEDGQHLIDCLSVSHPSWLTKEEISETDVPVQIIAPEYDGQFTAELKAYANLTIPKKGVAYEYCHFEGVVHRFASQPDFSEPVVDGERRQHEKQRMKGDGEREKIAWCRAQRSIVFWMREFLVES